VLFLIAASSLPDEASGGADLRDFYGRNRRYFWSLVMLFEIIYVAFGIHFLRSDMDRLPHAVIAAIIFQWSILVSVPAVLTLVQSRAIHYAGLALLFATVFWHYGRQVIT
jgi:hypothetical protein